MDLKKTVGFLINTICLNLLIISLIQAQPGFGGGRGLLRGPLQLGLQYDNFNPAEVHQITGNLAFKRLLGMRPDARINGHISNFNLAVGIQFFSKDSTNWRWRAGLLDANIISKNYLFKLRLIDFDQRGLVKELVQWFNAGFGLGRTIGNRKISLRPQLTGALGYSRIKLGLTNYPNFFEITDSTISGLDAGYQAIISVDLFSRINFSVDFSKRIVLDDIEPHIENWGINTSIRVGKRPITPLLLYFRYEKENIKIATTLLEQNNHRFLTGISYTIIPSPPRRDPFDW
jgi:hypothetical protein